MSLVWKFFTSILYITYIYLYYLYYLYYLNRFKQLKIVKIGIGVESADDTIDWFVMA
jgi:hypothetical protein